MSVIFEGVYTVYAAILLKVYQTNFSLVDKRA